MSTFLERVRMRIHAGGVVSKVAIIHKNHILIGRRTDDGKHDFPGGHAESQETAEEAAVRETYEEAGIRLPTVSYLGSQLIEARDGKQLMVYGFRYDAPAKLIASDTNEMIDWKWVTMEPGQPMFDAKNWHNANDFVLNKLGIRQ